MREYGLAREEIIVCTKLAGRHHAFGRHRFIVALDELPTVAELIEKRAA